MVMPVLGENIQKCSALLYLSTHSFKYPQHPHLLGNTFSMWYTKRKVKETLASKHKAVIHPSKQVNIPFFSEIPWNHSTLYCGYHCAGKV